MIFFNEQMKDPEFKAEWDALDPEFAVIEAILATRKESGLTQQQLSERTGIAQTDISKLTRQRKSFTSHPAAAGCRYGDAVMIDYLRQSEPPSRWPAAVCFNGEKLVHFSCLL